MYILAIGLIILMYGMQVSNYASQPETQDYAILLGFIDIIIISFFMIIVPLIMRLSNKEKFEYERGKKICSNNSWIMFGISILISALCGGTFIGVGGLGAIIYYYINMWFFSKPKSKIELQEIGIEEKKENIQFNKAKITEKPKNKSDIVVENKITKDSIIDKNDKYDALMKLQNLRKSGILNEEEFETEKKKIL